MATLLIGSVAERAGLSAPTIRYYESIGLLARPTRSAAGYRRYTDATVEELRFIKKAQALGFSLEEIGEVLKLSRAGRIPCAHVLDLARRHLATVDERIRQLTRFRDQLAGEISKWDGRRQPTCQGLCQIIAGAEETAIDAVPPDLHPREPSRRLARTGRRWQVCFSPLAIGRRTVIMPKSVTVYTQPGWPFCDQLKGFLRQKQIEFTERNIAADVRALDELQKLGWMTTPVTVIDGETVVGFNAARIEDLLRNASS